MLYIRADMNDKIASGHIMRCLSIADAAERGGEKTTFILADDQAAPLLEKRGHKYIILHTRWNDMDAELPVLKKEVEKHQIRSLLIDSYQITENYLRELSEVTKTFYIDDLNAFYYPVNGIICYANYWEEFGYPQTYKDTELYLGPQYIPLRKEFCNCKKKYIAPLVNNLLLMSGGSDPYQILPQILEQIEKETYQRIDVICGIYNTDYDRLKEKYQSDKNIFVHKAVDDIEIYMKQADLAVSAGGMTLYELCAVGTPAISYAIADNQRNNVRKFQEDSIIDYAGDARKEDVVSNIVRFICSSRENEKLRLERSKKMQSFVDGKGAERIADILKRGRSEGVEE